MHRKAAAFAARRGMLWSPMDPASTLGTCVASMPRRLHVWRWSYPPETALAQGRPLAGHLEVLQGASGDCTAKQRPALHVGGCFGHPGTQPAPLGRPLHRCQDTCTCGAGLTHQKLNSHKAEHLQGTLRTCRARQRPAPQSSGLRCTSGDALAPQGPGQHLWDVCCIDATTLARVALALPTRNWPSRRPAICKAR